MYGLETLHLTDAMSRKLDVFQLKGLRKILNMETTFINRANSNKRVYEKASELAYPKPEDKRQVKRFSDFHKERKAKLLGHIARTEDSDPLREITFQPGTTYRVEYGKKRIGKPRQNWIRETKRFIYVDKQGLFSYTEAKREDDQILQWAKDRRF